jgi:hypothetical protein
MGDIQVVGVSGKTNISVRARFVAGANSDADAEAAFRDVESQLLIEKHETGWQVECREAAERHGSATPSSTGCARLLVEVPAGSLEQPISLSVTGEMAGAHVSGLVVKRLDVRMPFGIVADVSPVPEAEIDLYGEDLVSGICNTILRVPADTGFQSLELEVQNPELTYAGVDPNDPEFILGVGIEGFADAPYIAPRTGHFSWTRLEQPVMTEAVSLRASLGKAIVTTGPVPPLDDLGLCGKMQLEL